MGNIIKPIANNIVVLRDTTGHKQSDGNVDTQAEFTSLGRTSCFDEYQIQITPSATPSAGTVKIYVQLPKCTTWAYVGEFTITDNMTPITYYGVCQKIRITPVAFDAAKTFSAFIIGINK